MIIAALVIARMLSGRSTSRRWSVYAPGGGLAPFRHVWYRYRPRAGVHLYVARRESAWAGIILFPHTAKPLRVVVNQGQQFCGRAWPWPRFCAKTPAKEFLGHLDSISAARTNAVLARGRAQ